MNALLLAAMIAIESGGQVAAVGDGGRAVGVLQVHPVIVADVNRIYGTRYTLADRRCPERSRELCELYLGHYVTAARIGRPPTPEHYARVWNGGPRGHLKPATLRYWAKVKAAMASVSTRQHRR